MSVKVSELQNKLSIVFPTWKKTLLSLSFSNLNQFTNLSINLNEVHVSYKYILDIQKMPLNFKLWLFKKQFPHA